MDTVAVIGAGDLGGAVAQALAARDRVGRIVLVDESRQVAAGKALDILQSGAVDGFRTQLTATDDFTAVIGAAACVVADRVAPSATEWVGEEGLAMLARVAPYLSGAPLIFAGVNQVELMLRAATELRVPPRQLIGSSTEAFASAVRSIVALEAQSSPTQVMLAVLGTPPSRLVVPWSEASIEGYALERVLTQVQLTRIEARAARLWPPGACTLGVAAARLSEAVLTSSRRRFNALTVLGAEFGVRNRIGAVPVLVNTRGVADVRVPTLTTRERVLLETALQA